MLFKLFKDSKAKPKEVIPHGFIKLTRYDTPKNQPVLVRSRDIYALTRFNIGGIGDDGYTQVFLVGGHDMPVTETVEEVVELMEKFG